VSIKAKTFIPPKSNKIKLLSLYRHNTHVIITEATLTSTELQPL